MKICVYGAASNEIDNSFIKAGEKLGEEIGRRGHSLIFGGGADGMMGASARGVYRTNGDIIGIAPEFFDVDGILYENITKLIKTKDMKERKDLLWGMADAIITTPGGIGTYDEFYEVLTLKQLGIHKKPIVVLNVDGYFNYMLKTIDNAIEKNFMYKESKSLFFVTDNEKDALDYIENYEASDFSILEMRKIRKK